MKGRGCVRYVRLIVLVDATLIAALWSTSLSPTPRNKLSTADVQEYTRVLKTQRPEYLNRSNKNTHIVVY